MRALWNQNLLVRTSNQFYSFVRFSYFRSHLLQRTEPHASYCCCWILLPPPRIWYISLVHCLCKTRNHRVCCGCAHKCHQAQASFCWRSNNQIGYRLTIYRGVGELMCRVLLATRRRQSLFSVRLSCRSGDGASTNIHGIVTAERWRPKRDNVNWTTFRSQIGFRHKCIGHSQPHKYIVSPDDNLSFRRGQMVQVPGHWNHSHAIKSDMLFGRL